MKPRTMEQRIYYARVWQGKRSLAAFGALVAKAEGRKQPYTANTVCRWEHGNSAPDLSTMIAIARASGLREEWILLNKGEPADNAHNLLGVG